MRKNKIKIILSLLIALNIILIGINAYAHSGRTDSSGGHKDNENKSGLGNYHYHCGGYLAHLHTNGVCPYSSNSPSSKNSTPSSSYSKSSSSSSNKTTTITIPATIDVTGIQINESINSIEVGKSKILTAAITPSNATNKNVTWKSSDENIAIVSIKGEVIAKKCGIVDITASSSNGKTSTIKINIKEENNAIIKTSTTSKTNVTSNTITNNQEDSNPLGGILTLGLLGGGGYLGYKKYKKEV